MSNNGMATILYGFVQQNDENETWENALYVMEEEEGEQADTIRQEVQRRGVNLASYGQEDYFLHFLSIEKCEQTVGLGEAYELTQQFLAEVDPVWKDELVACAHLLDISLEQAEPAWFVVASYG